MATQGWQTVTRHGKPSTDPNLETTSAFTPYSSAAQALYTNPNHQKIAVPSSKNPRRCVQPPPFIVSPTSPVRLPFPPKPYFDEWKARCFRCFTKGHHSDTCNNESRCALCWEEGHEFVDCPNARRDSTDECQRIFHGARRAPPPPPPTPPTPVVGQWVDADFSDLFLKGSSSVHSTLPDDNEHPDEISCYLTRDLAYNQEVARLSRALVVTQPEDFEVCLSLDDIASKVAKPGLVTPKQLQVASLHGGRFLVLPPPDVSAIQLAHAFPKSLWEMGFSVQLWSRHLDADFQIP